MNPVVRAATVLLSVGLVSAGLTIGVPAAALAAEPAPDDACSNIADVQSVPPEGYVSLVDGTCVAAQLGTAPTENGADSGSESGSDATPAPTETPSDATTGTPAPEPSPTATAAIAAPYTSSTRPPRMDAAAVRAAGLGALAAGLLAAIGAVAHRRRSLR